ncbi:MAG TPA: hypothetical protein VN734_14190 [Acidobacteriaceae bacterium]|nr:hypothetical protein [Acidobacteriaceae bacterium]
MAANLTQTVTDLAIARREQTHLIARLRDLKQELRDLEVLIDLGQRTVARLKQRQHRATIAASKD